VPGFPRLPRRGCFRLLRPRRVLTDNYVSEINLGVSAILMGGHSRLAVWWQGSLGSGVPQIAMLVFIFAIFYFLLIMPQQRKQKKWQAMLSALKTGDKVTTSGGLRGTIISLKEDALTLRVPPDNL
jgi:preprotein translocase subunit YajC